MVLESRSLKVEDWNLQIYIYIRISRMQPNSWHSVGSNSTIGSLNCSEISLCDNLFCIFA